MTIHALFNNGKLVYVTEQAIYNGTPTMNEVFDKEGNKVEFDEARGTWDFKSLEEVEEYAKMMSDLNGELWLPVDNGGHVSRQYTICKAPTIGSEVSYAFNGDSYPCGKIVRITKTWQVIAEDEDGCQIKFTRYKQTAGWKRVGGTWWMIHGHVSKQNPHF